MGVLLVAAGAGEIEMRKPEREWSIAFLLIGVLLGSIGGFAFAHLPKIKPYVCSYPPPIAVPCQCKPCVRCPDPSECL